MQPDPVSPQHDAAAAPAGFVERRRQPGRPTGQERRQFASSHEGLSPEARALALAIDSYKLQHRRRYITFEEMLHVIRQLGYVRRDVADTADELSPLDEDRSME